MKKLFPLLCLFTLLFAFTCEDEPLDFDAESFDADPELLGEWNLISFDASVSTSTNFQGQQIESDVEINSTTVDYTLNFTQSNFNTNGSYSYIADVTANGIDIPAEPYTLTDVNGNGSYSVSGNEMTIDGSFFEFSFEGMDFAELQGEQTVTFQITDNGQTLTFSQNDTTTETDPTGATVTSFQVSTSVWSRSTVSNTCDAEAETNAAATAYNQDNTNEDLCIAYKNALENQIAECGDTNGSLQDIIDELGDCSVSTAGGTLKVTTGTLPIEFTQQTISIEDGLITVEGVSAGGSYEIYFQITEGDTGTDVLQNFVLTLNGTEYFPSTQGFDDFTSDTTVSTGNVLQATFFGLVESSGGADLNLTQGVVDVTY
ncbi:hypothetical protein [Winogradskyella sp.]|uniref:hypothetical protein n=1 Tax=Winogradskyella sp. TaxID=1883156 RepID=UPI003F6D5980